MKHYDNPHCTDISEFEDDLKRFQYIRKLFGRYRQENDLKERLILNHLIVIYNVFGHEATEMLFFRLHEYHEFLRPFIEYLNFMPNVVSYDNIQIAAESIVPDEYIVNILKGI
jgi:hypothetical protein